MNAKTFVSSIPKPEMSSFLDNKAAEDGFQKHDLVQTQWSTNSDLTMVRTQIYSKVGRVMIYTVESSYNKDQHHHEQLNLTINND